MRLQSPKLLVGVIFPLRSIPSPNIADRALLDLL